MKKILDNFNVFCEEEYGKKYWKSTNLGLSDDEYDMLKPVIGFLNGCWREKEKCFVFGYNPTQILKDMFEMYELGAFDNGVYSDESTGKLPLNLLPFAYREWQEKLQYYPTPTHLAKEVVEKCGITDNDIVLEPSAGQGALLEHIVDCKAIIPVEKDLHNFKVLKEMGYNPICASFEDVIANKTIERPTKVVMNPPFFKGLDIKHIRLAYDYMQEGGTLVAIMSENNLYYDNDRVKDFHKFLKEVNAEIIDVPFGTFACSGTMVYTVIIKIQK